ncbi:MAG: hypothetical protein ABJZ55_19655 [Fuerstiella sp.]
MDSLHQPSTFDDLAEARRNWITSILKPWCQTAARKELLKANAEWLDIAGKVDADATLWTWAWERFPILTHPDLSLVNETYEVDVTLIDGTKSKGFPDARRSQQGELVLVRRDPETGATLLTPPMNIDHIQSVERVA